MIKKISRLSALGLLGIMISMTSIEQAQAQKPTQQAAKIAPAALYADQVKPSFETAIIDSLLIKNFEDEEGVYPADDLYDGWNTEYVKAYNGVFVPDSFRIDISGFVMPVESKVTSNYGYRGRRFHYGTDLQLQTGDTVYAAFDGKIRVVNFERKGYGNYIVIRHPNGLETVYGHLSAFLINQDQTVEAGQPIGLGGSTGRSTGPHLHFEFRFLGNAINPGEIIDFDEWAIKDDYYVYVKGKSGESYHSASAKYLAHSKGKLKYYRIKKGDTLGTIARRQGIAVDKLCRLNKLRPNSTLHVGKSLRLS